jgi:hypothetical protein
MILRLCKLRRLWQLATVLQRRSLCMLNLAMAPERMVLDLDLHRLLHVWRLWRSKRKEPTLSQTLGEHTRDRNSPGIINATLSLLPHRQQDHHHRHFTMYTFHDAVMDANHRPHHLLQLTTLLGLTES